MLQWYWLVGLICGGVLSCGTMSCAEERLVTDATVSVEQQVSESDDLIDKVVTAQAGRVRVYGTLMRSITRAEPDPDLPSEAQEWRVHLALETPNKYHIRFSQVELVGEYESFLSNGIMQWHVDVWDVEEEPVVKAEPINKEQRAGIQQLQDFFPLNRTALAKEFTLQAVKNTVGSVISLSPKSVDLQKNIQRIEMQVNEHGDTTDVIIYDTDGNKEMYHVDDIEYNGTLPKGIFEYKE